MPWRPYATVVLLSVGLSVLPGVFVFPQAEAPGTPAAKAEEKASPAAGWAAYEENHAAAKELGLAYDNFARLSLPQGAVLCAPFTGSYELQEELNSTATRACEGLVGDQWQALVAGQYLFTVFRWDATKVHELAQGEVARSGGSLRDAQRTESFIGVQPGYGVRADPQVSLANVLPLAGVGWLASLARVSGTEVRVTEDFGGMLGMAGPRTPRTWVCHVGDRFGPSLTEGEGAQRFAQMGAFPIESIVEIHDNHVVTAAWNVREQRWCGVGLYQMKFDGQGAPLPLARPTAAELYLQERLAAAQALAVYCQQEYAEGQRVVELVTLGGLTVPYPGGRDRGRLYELSEAQAHRAAAEADFSKVMGKPTAVRAVLGCRAGLAWLSETLMRDRGEVGATAEQVREITHQLLYGTRVFGLVVRQGMGSSEGRYEYRLPLRTATAALEAEAPELLRAKVPEWALEAVKAELSFPPTAEQLGYGAPAEPPANAETP